MEHAPKRDQLRLTAVSFVLAPRAVHFSIAHVLLCDALVSPTVYHAGATFVTIEFVGLVFAVDVSVALPVLRNAPFQVALETVGTHWKKINVCSKLFTQ